MQSQNAVSAYFTSEQILPCTLSVVLPGGVIIFIGCMAIPRNTAASARPQRCASMSLSRANYRISSQPRHVAPCLAGGGHDRRWPRSVQNCTVRGDSAEEVYSRALLSSTQVMYLSEAGERKTLEMRGSPMKPPPPSVCFTRDMGGIHR